MKRKFISFAIALMYLSAGCGHKKVITKNDFNYCGGEKIYFTLKATKVGESYSYSMDNIFHAPPKDGGFLLNNLGPDFNTGEQKCGIWEGDVQHKRNEVVCDGNANHFRRLAVDKSTTTFVNVLGTALTVGTMPLLNAVTKTHFKYSYFDEKEWRDSIEKVVSDKIPNRCALIDEYENKKSFALSALSSINLVSSSVGKDNIAINIVDSSGLYKGKPDFSNLISAKRGTRPDISFKTILKEIDGIDAVDYVRKLNSLESVVLSVGERAKRYNSELYFNYPKSGALDGYIYSIVGPNDNLQDLGAEKYEFSLNVVGKNYGLVIPDFQMANEHIVLNVSDDGRMKISNLSSLHVDILAVSVYGGDAISTRTSSEMLPPHSFVDTYNVKSIIDSKVGSSMTFNNMDKSSVLSSNVTYGYAIKYRVSGLAADQSLNKVTSVPLGSFLN